MPHFEPLCREIFTVSELLSPQECQDYIDLSESLGYYDAPINSMAGPIINSSMRNNQRVMLDDQDRAVDLWERIREYVPERIMMWKAVGVNERLRFYRYHVGQQFDWHADGSFHRPHSQERSLLTYMIYLSEGCQGGETSFHEPARNLPKHVKITPKTGMALLFAHRLLHKGEPVEEGCKYVLRTDVMYAPAS